MKYLSAALFVASASLGFGQTFSGVGGSYEIRNQWSLFNPGFQGSGTSITSGVFGTDPVDQNPGQDTWFRSQFSQTSYSVDVQTHSSYWNDGPGGSSMSSDRRSSTFSGYLEIAEAGNYTITAVVQGVSQIGPAEITWLGLGLDETLTASPAGIAIRTFTAWLDSGTLTFSGLTTTGTISSGNSSASGTHRVRFAVQAVPEPSVLSAMGVAFLAFVRQRKRSRASFSLEHLESKQLPENGGRY